MVNPLCQLHKLFWQIYPSFHFMKDKKAERGAGKVRGEIRKSAHTD